MRMEHTDKRYEDELKKLREDILYMGGLVEDQIQKAVKSLVDRESALAEVIIERDHEVNRLDVEIDDLCIRLLALHQPAAKDLRFITTALKITVARWLGPDGTQIPREGIVPDIKVELTDDDAKAGKDPQMDKAVEILSKK